MPEMSHTDFVVAMAVTFVVYLVSLCVMLRMPLKRVRLERRYAEEWKGRYQKAAGYTHDTRSGVMIPPPPSRELTCEAPEPEPECQITLSVDDAAKLLGELKEAYAQVSELEKESEVDGSRPAIIEMMQGVVDRTETPYTAHLAPATKGSPEPVGVDPEDTSATDGDGDEIDDKILAAKSLPGLSKESLEDPLEGERVQRKVSRTGSQPGDPQPVAVEQQGP